MELDTPEPLTIALDYDGTYSADPAMWDKFIKVAQAHGHCVICVTMRNATLTERLDMAIDVVYTNRKGKVAECERLGIKVDIWIDDSPHFLVGDAAPALPTDFELPKEMEPEIDWQPISTIPLGKKIRIKTATGMVRIAICNYRPRAHSRTITPRAQCQSRDRETVGDLRAVAWAPLEYEDGR